MEKFKKEQIEFNSKITKLLSTTIKNQKKIGILTILLGISIIITTVSVFILKKSM